MPGALMNETHNSKNPILSFYSSFIVPKGSPLKVIGLQILIVSDNLIAVPLICMTLQGLFQNDVMWLRDTGILDKMKYDMLKTEMSDPLPKVWKDKPLNLYQLGIIMIITLLGVTSSIMVFIWELVGYPRR